MNKPWIGYLASLLLMIAGVLMIAGDKIIPGIILIVAALLSLGLKIFLFSKKNSGDRS